MRIWDLSPKKLCRAHLLGEHRELHAIWSVLVNGKKGYARHPETWAWVFHGGSSDNCAWLGETGVCSRGSTIVAATFMNHAG